MNKEEWTQERAQVDKDIAFVKHDMTRQQSRDGKAIVPAGPCRRVVRTLKAALGTLDALGYTYHGGELFAPPLGPARPAQAPVAASSMVTVPVLKSFDATVTVGELRLHRDHLPPLHDWHVGFGYTQQADGSQDLISAALVPDKLGGFGPKKDFTREEVEELLREVRETVNRVWDDKVQGFGLARDAAEFFKNEAQRLLEEKVTSCAS